MELYYSVLTFISIFAMCIIQISVRFSNTLTKSKKKSFYILFNAIIVAAFCEWFATMLEGTGPSTQFLHSIVKCTELSVAPYIAFLFVFVIEKRNQKFIYSFLGINVLFEILSVFFDFIFTVDAKSNYTHAPFYWIYVLFYLLSIFYCVYYMAKTVKKYQFGGFSFFIYMALFMLLGISIQLMNKNIKVDYLVMGILSIMLYVFILELINQTDQVTGLLNRRAYENYIERLNKKSLILFFDVDEFKRINDQYGHIYGDLCLKKIAQVIRKDYGEFGLCFRYGGDEFCVILTSDLNKINAINQHFFHSLDLLRQKEEKDLPNVSLGYAVFDLKKENLSDVIEKADRMMYQNKQKNKEVLH